MFGRPVIASDIGGLGERVRDAVDGFKFPARDAASLALLLLKATGNEAEWMRMNRQIAMPRQLDEMLDAHLQLLFEEGR